MTRFSHIGSTIVCSAFHEAEFLSWRSLSTHRSSGPAIRHRALLKGSLWRRGSTRIKKRENGLLKTRKSRTFSMAVDRLANLPAGADAFPRREHFHLHFWRTVERVQGSIASRRNRGSLRHNHTRSNRRSHTSVDAGVFAHFPAQSLSKKPLFSSPST